MNEYRTKCNICNNNGSYLVAQYKKIPNGATVQDGWKSEDCENCKTIVKSKHMIKTMKNRLSLIENEATKTEIRKLLEMLD